MTAAPLLAKYVGAWRASPFGTEVAPPWSLTQRAKALISEVLRELGPDYVQQGGVASHRSATIEAGAVIKAPAILGPECFIAAGAYLRDGVYLSDRCVIGPGCELKSSFLFSAAKLAHFNFVGDSILGSQVNLEAGAVVANYRNESEDKRLRVRLAGEYLDTGVEKFGSLIGDGTRIGANSVIAPGHLLLPGTIVPRLTLLDEQ